MDTENQNNRPAISWPQKLRRLIVRCFVGGGLLYGGIIVMLAINEPYLVYPGSKFPRGNWKPTTFTFEEVKFESHDGIQIVGWYLPKPGATETVLVCHGNAENVAQSASHTGVTFQNVLNANVLVFDYRGYGKSEGTPFEAAILNDTEAAMHWLNHKTNTRPNDVVVVGHSIGGGPAVHVAANLGAKALFLQRTFSSLVEPAQSRFWFVPVTYIMQNRFPSAEKIKSCNVPVHQSHGDCDGLVPYASGRKLFECSPSPLKEFFVNRGKGHWDVLPDAYWLSVQNFMGKVNAQVLAGLADHENAHGGTGGDDE